MMTTEASSTTMSWATAITASALKRLGSRSGITASAGLSMVEVMVSPVLNMRMQPSAGGISCPRS